MEFFAIIGLSGLCAGSIWLLVWVVIGILTPTPNKPPEKNEELLKWFEKLVLLVEMGELKVVQHDDKFGTVELSNLEGKRCLVLFREPNWWNVVAQYNHVCIMGELESELKDLLKGSQLKTEDTKPIHKFLEKVNPKDSLDKMIATAIEKHGVDQ